MPPEKPPALSISRTEQILCYRLTPRGHCVPPWRQSDLPSPRTSRAAPIPPAAALSAFAPTTPCRTALPPYSFSSACTSQPMGRCSWAATAAPQCRYAVKGPAGPTREPGATPAVAHAHAAHRRTYDPNGERPCGAPRSCTLPSNAGKHAEYLQNDLLLPLSSFSSPPGPCPLSPVL